MSDDKTISLSQRTIWSWAVHNCKPWLNRALHRSETYEQMLQFNDVSDVGYVFKVDRGQVTLLPKPADLDHIEAKMVAGQRSAYYRNFLQQTIDKWLPGFDTLLCISMCDGAAHHPYIPTFCFQKVAGMKQILLPDIEFLIHEFYEDEKFQDAESYAAKQASAIFVGSTTGAINTKEVVQNLSSPRLDAAQFFSHNSEVQFRLPGLVQCESEEVREMLSRLPFCTGGYTSWSDQLKHRFLISIDGNGATCSRVVQSLKSNSVMLKYESPCLLYYFDFMKPNTHYVPIRQHGEVQELIKIERQWPGLLAPIASASNRFAKNFLDRSGVEFYMAALLIIYNYSILKFQHRGLPDLAWLPNNSLGELVRNVVEKS